MTLGEILEEFENLDRCDVYYDRRWDQCRESMCGSEYVRYDELSELVHKFRTNLMMADEAVVCITKEQFDSMKKDKHFLRALESEGVANWRGYGIAQEIMREEED